MSDTVDRVPLLIDRQIPSCSATLEMVEALAQAQLALIECRDATTVFEVMGDFLARSVPDSLAVVNEIDNVEMTSIVRSISGVDERLMSRLKRMAHIDPVGMTSLVADWYVPYLNERRLFHVPGGLAAFAERDLSTTVSRTIERILGIKGLYAIGIASGDSVYGLVTILTKKRSRGLPVSLIESFVYACFLTLSRIRATEELRLAEERQDMLLEGMSEAFAVFEVIAGSDGMPSDLRHAEVNSMYLALLGLPSEEVVGCCLSEMFPGTARELIARLADSALQGIPSRSTGHWAAIDRHLDLFAYVTQPGRLSVLIDDVTAHVDGERELEQHRQNLEALVAARTSELRRTNEDLKHATAAKSAFLANMSHELRTPLNSIIGFSGVLAQGIPGQLNEEQDRQVTMINNSGRYLLNLVDDVLDLAKIEAGKIELRYGTVVLGELMEEVHTFSSFQAQEKGLEFVVHTETPGLRIEVDCGKTKQILLNIVGNAVKFTRSGTVELTATSDESAVYFSVSDTGPGISAGDIRLVFDKFTQVGNDDEAKPSGTGLGLALSREIAWMLGGDISVESSLGRGSTFTLKLPRGAPSSGA